MEIKTRQTSTDSPKREVGEIDTSAPFQSVKAAVSLFGEGAFLAEKPTAKKAKPLPTERVFAKETELHLAQKELNKFKEQLKNAEITKSQALVELERLKKTAEELSKKLQSVTKSKESAAKATDAAKSQAKQLEIGNSDTGTGNADTWKQELENAREQYKAAVTELDAAKHDLWKIRQDFEVSMNQKFTAFEQAEAAEHASEANKERASELSKELASVQESVVHVKLASVQAQQEQAKILSDKDALRKSSKLALEEAHKKLESLRKQFDPEVVQSLEGKLDETTAEIRIMHQEMESAKLSDLESVRSVTTELDDAKETLQRVAEEETTLRDLLESLKQELECVKKEHLELKEKEAQAESIAGNLHVKLRKTKIELETATAEESKTRGASEELISSLQQLSLESENAKREAEMMRKEAEELEEEVEAARVTLGEVEKKLQVALKEAEEAKAAEARALDHIKILSEKTNAARASTSEIGAHITMSQDEHAALSRKVEESNSLAEMKVAAALAQVEAVRASENEALKRLEVTEKEIQEIQAATDDALKRAEMAEAAKRAVEGELRKWREKEQKRAAETASRILAETQVSMEASPTQVVKSSPPEKSAPAQKGEKTSTPRKTLLPNLSGIFQRRKSLVDGGSPSYLPGEKPTRLTICEGHDGTETSNGDILIFPDMVRYRRLTHFDVDTFVEEVLVKDTEWLPGTPEPLRGWYVFVCSHGSRDRKCGVCGPVLVTKFKEEIDSRSLQGQVTVSPCSHIGGHKYAGNVIIFGPHNGEVTGHWYGYVAPDDVSILLEHHIVKGEIVDHLWRGQMGLSEEEQRKSQELRLQLMGEPRAAQNSSIKPIQSAEIVDDAVKQADINTDGCCQSNGGFCCQTPTPVVHREKSERNHVISREGEGEGMIRENRSKESKISGKGAVNTTAATRKVCAMPTWYESWEREDTYAVLAVAGALVSVAVAYNCYRQLR